MKKAVIFLGVLAAFFTILLIHEKKAEASEPDNGWYTIQTKSDSSFGLGLLNNSVILQKLSNLISQKFKITKLSEGVYKVEIKGPTGMLSLKSGGGVSKYDGSRLMQWQLEHEGDCYYLKNLGTGNYLSYLSLTKNSGIIERIKSIGNTQKFALVKSGFTVTFKNDNGSVIKQEEVDPGGSASPPSEPVKTGYTFVGWNKLLTDIKSDLEVFPKWKAKSVRVKFDINIPNTNRTWTETYIYDKDSFLGMYTSNKEWGRWTRPGYVLAGWSYNKNATYASYPKTAKVVNGWINTDYKQLFAVWKPAKKVTFRSRSTIIKTEMITGNKATAPTGAEFNAKAPNGTKYTFIKWNGDYNNITRDTVITADYWYERNNNSYLYRNNELAKGLQKVNDKWYLLNKTTGRKEQEGDKILIGSWYNRDTPELTRFFIGLDGHNFVYSSNFTPVRGRHMNFITENGTFYGLKAAVMNDMRKDAKNPASFKFDFGIRATSTFSDSVYKNTGLPWIPNSYWQWHLIKGAYAKLGKDTRSRSTPKWFIDNGKKYVFYALDKYTDDKVIGTKTNTGKRDYRIYRTEITGLQRNDTNKVFVTETATTPQEMILDKYPPQTGDRYGVHYPCVTKQGNTYIMFVVDETLNWKDQSKQGAIWVCTSTDLKNWKFKYIVDKKVLPHSLTTRTNAETGRTDTDLKGNPRHFYRYYIAPFLLKLGNTWHLYVEEVTMGKEYSNGGEDDFSGKIIHLTTNDLLSNNWTNKGYINVGRNRIRSGGIMTVNDSQCEKVVQNLFNR